MTMRGVTGTGTNRNSTTANIVELKNNKMTHLKNLKIFLKKENLAFAIEDKWLALDNFCNSLYELRENDIALINSMGRTSRVALLK